MCDGRDQRPVRAPAVGRTVGDEMNATATGVDLLTALRARNPELDVVSVHDPRFVEYGLVHRIGAAGASPVDGPLLALARSRFEQSDGPVSYTVSDPELEGCPELDEIRGRVFGEVDVQAGCCWGTSTRMNGMEFHKSSELVGAATDLVLIVGRVQDIHDGHWDAHRAAFVHVPAGTFVELYATTLHLAPCRVSAAPFCAVIVLPRGRTRRSTTVPMACRGCATSGCSPTPTARPPPAAPGSASTVRTGRSTPPDLERASF